MLLVVSAAAIEFTSEIFGLKSQALDTCKLVMALRLCCLPYSCMGYLDITINHSIQCYFLHCYLYVVDRILSPQILRHMFFADLPTIFSTLSFV